MEPPDRLLQLLDDEPQGLNIEAALTRVHAAQPARPHRRIWYWPVAAFASLASVLIAEQALSLFEIRKVVPLRYPAGQLPMELMLPNVFPLFPAKQVRASHAANAGEASAQAGYRVRILRSPQLSAYEPSFRVEHYPAVERTIDRARIEAALTARRAPPIAFPAALDGGTVAIRWRGPAVLTHYGHCPRLIGPWDACVFLIQQNPPALELPAGVNLSEYTEFSLRLIGLSPADARALREQLPVAPSLFLPFDESTLDVSIIPLLNGTGTLVRYKPTPAGQAFTLQWTEGGQLFTLTGRDPSQAAAMANSLEPQ
ncbi:MAG: hypothetical protein K2X03_07770 [Bryobacteraceae bacterium]|nr:hypothetical protein [Bryobacteraceae bacterium]